MDNQSNPMGLLAPFVAALTAAVQTMIAAEVTKALAERAGAANAAALLDDALDERIRAVCLPVIDGAIESHNEGGFHLGTDDVREVVGDYDFDDKIESAIEDYDFDDKIESAIEDYDFDDKIESAIDNYDLGDKVATVLANGSFSFSA